MSSPGKRVLLDLGDQFGTARHSVDDAVAASPDLLAERVAMPTAHAG